MYNNVLYSCAGFFCQTFYESIGIMSFLRKLIEAELSNFVKVKMKTTF